MYVGTTLNVAGASTLAAITGTFNGTVGATTPSTGAFTTLSATSTTTHQGVFSGWDSVGGANSQNGSITIGSASSNQGVIHYRGSSGSTALYIDNTYDVAASAVTIRTRTSGTPVEVGTFTSTGLAVTGTLSATGAITSTLATGQWLGNVSGNTTTLYSLVNNSGGYLIQGVSSSTGGAWASGLNSNYASFLGTIGNTDLIFGTQNVGRMKIAGADGIVTMNAYGAGAATFSAAGVISSVSDETWKVKDGAPVDTDAMLNKLEPGYWYYNDEKKETFGKDRQLGFYAQNVNAAIGPEAAPEPETVTTKNDDGTETSVTKPWGYYDRSVLAVTVMSLQKALATIESLTARITALEAK